MRTTKKKSDKMIPTIWDGSMSVSAKCDWELCLVYINGLDGQQCTNVALSNLVVNNRILYNKHTWAWLIIFTYS